MIYWEIPDIGRVTNFSNPLWKGGVGEIWITDIFHKVGVVVFHVGKMGIE